MSNIRIILDGTIDTFKTANSFDEGIQDSQVFEIFSLTQITKDYGLSLDDIQGSIVDGCNDGGIDSIIVLYNGDIVYSLDEVKGYMFSKYTETRIIISQCKAESSFREAPLDKLIATIPDLFDLRLDEKQLLKRYNSALVELSLIARHAFFQTNTKGGKLILEFNYITKTVNQKLSKVIKLKIDQIKRLSTDTLNPKQCLFNMVDANALLVLYRTEKSNITMLPFKDSPLPCVSIDGSNGYVGVVLLNDFYDFLTDNEGKIKEDLFESNVRHFYNESDVNKAIRNSIINNDNTIDFWWLNNGITIISDNVTQAGKTLSLENAQIVNGLQTSVTIHKNYTKSPEDARSVLIKILSTRDKTNIDKIIASTNTQNPVSNILLRATDETQRNIEQYFLNNGYYYDRRRNYYKNQGKPSAQIFNMQIAAQAVMSIVLNKPHIARATPTSLFKVKDHYDNIFQPERDFRSILNSCLILKQSSILWQSLDDSKKSTVANFKLHMAWLLPKFVLSKTYVSHQDVIRFSLSSDLSEYYLQAVDFLIDSIGKFHENNQDANLINMAKSSDFTEFIIRKLKNSIVTEDSNPVSSI